MNVVDMDDPEAQIIEGSAILAKKDPGEMIVTVIEERTHAGTIFIVLRLLNGITVLPMAILDTTIRREKKASKYRMLIQIRSSGLLLMWIYFQDIATTQSWVHASGSSKYISTPSSIASTASTASSTRSGNGAGVAIFSAPPIDPCRAAGKTPSHSCQARGAW
jgi:hypothetical protein